MADNKELVIRLKLDKTAADASGQQFVAAEKARNKQLLDDAKAQQAAQTELVRRANAAKIKAIADAADEAKKKAKEEAAAAKQAAQEAVAAAKSAKDQERAARRAAAEEAKRLAAETAEAERQAARDAAAAAKKAAAEERAAKKAAADDVKRQAKEKAAAEREAASAAKETADAESFVASGLLSIVQGAVGIGTVTSAMKAMMGAVAGANEEVQKQVNELLRVKDMIREISMITGNKAGPDYSEVRKFGELRVASGLSNEEARDLSLEYEGSIGAAKGKNISEAESDRLKPMVARLAATAGGGADAAGTYGKLTGLLGGLKHYDKAEDLLAETAQFNKIISLGVGNNPTLIKQAAQVAGAFINEQGTGIVKDSRELGGLTAVASRINPDTAAETLKSTARVTRGFGEKWGGLLKQANVGEHDTMGAALQKLFRMMEKAEKSGRSVDTYLAEQGVDMHGRQSLMSMYSYRAMLGDITANESLNVTPAQAQAEIEQKYAADTSLRIKQRQAQNDYAQMQNAERMLPNRELELAAQARIEARGEGQSNPAARAEDLWAGGAATAFGTLLPSGMTQEELGRRIRVEHEKQKMMQEAGVALPNRPQERSLLGGYTADYVNWLTSGESDQMYSSAAQEATWAGKMRIQGPGIPNAARPPAAAPGAGPLPGLGAPGGMPNAAAAVAGGDAGPEAARDLKQAAGDLKQAAGKMHPRPNLNAQPRVQRR